jgi:hypothetical protein
MVLRGTLRANQGGQVDGSERIVAGDREIEVNTTQKQILEEILRVVVASREEALISSAETRGLLRRLVAALGDKQPDENPLTDRPTREETITAEPEAAGFIPPTGPSNLLEALAALAATEAGEGSAASAPAGEETVALVQPRHADGPAQGADDEAESSAAEESALANLRELAVEAGLDTENDAFHRKSCGQMVWPWKGGVDGGPALCSVCGLPNGEFLRTGGDRRKALEKMAEADRREGVLQVPLGSIGRWVQDRRRELGAD